MQLGIKYNCCKGLEDETQVKLMRENGFECTFLMCDTDRFYERARLLKDEHIFIESLHAPYPSDASGIDDLWEDGERGKEAFSAFLHHIEQCARCEVPTLVTHPTSTGHPHYPSEVGLRRFEQLFLRAREIGVRIAFENICCFEVLRFFLETMPDADFCFDCGHEATERVPHRHLPIFASRLKVLHLHDNFLFEDHHLIPYDGKIDFDRVTREIAESPFCGSVMLELKQYASTQYDALSPEEYYRRAARAAMRLEREIASHRANNGIQNK